MSEIERRFFSTELRMEETEEAEAPRIVGYAARFNEPSADLGGFIELIRPGAFVDSLANDVRALFNHNINYPLGRTVSETLRLAEDKTGLWYAVDLPDTQYARDLLTSIKRGDVSQSSFAFQVEAEVWLEPDEQRLLPLRILERVNLLDVSPVTYPAYPTTSVQARSKCAEILSGSQATARYMTEAETARRRLRLRQQLQLKQLEI